MSTSAPDALADAAKRACPGFVAAGVLHRSATSVLIDGHVWGEPAVAKILASTSPFWRETFAREIDTYRFFERHHPPFLAPRLIAADDRYPLLVLERLSGAQLAGARHPDEEIAPRRLAAVLTALGRVNGWRAPVGDRPRTLDYRSRFDRLRRGGQLTPAEGWRLANLLERVADAAEFCHGDPVPTHILRRVDDYKEGNYGLVDWAFAGVFLPGFDLAKLWAVLGATFGVRSEIEDSVRARGDDAWAAFLLNLTVVVGQELRTERGPRLETVESDWQQIRSHLAATPH